LIHRNSFNITAMSFDPEAICAEIKKHIPTFEISYEADFRQAIADSWPSSIDDSVAKADWGYAPKFSTEKMTETMLENLKIKLATV